MMKLDFFIHFLIEQKLVEADEAEVVKFGMEQGIRYILNIGVTLLLGVIFHEVVSISCFLICFMALRSFAGGYHAKTALRCLIISHSINILVLVLIHNVNWSVMLSVSIVIIATLVLWKIAPIENEKRILDDAQKHAFRKISRYILIIEDSIVILSMCFDKVKIMEAGTLAILMTCLLAVLGKWELKKIVY